MLFKNTIKYCVEQKPVFCAITDILSFVSYYFQTLMLHGIEET
jgi:hypothetical protein